MIQAIRTQEDIAAGLAVLLRIDHRFGRIIDAAGPIPLRRADPGFAGIAGVIVAQMISKASAAAIQLRMDTHFGSVEAAGVLATSDETFRSLGLSRAKVAALRGVAGAVTDGALDLEAVCRLEAGEAIAVLSALPGIGRWTAEVYLLLCAGHPDLFPAGDVALQSAVAHASGTSIRPTARELDAMAAGWRPVRSVAARLFWAYYAGQMRRGAVSGAS